MSEKRFCETERACYYTSLVRDTLINEKLGTDKVVDLLNSLYDEKRFCEEMAQNLKSENEQLRQLYKVYEKAEEVEEKAKDCLIQELKEENEQLQKQCFELEKDYLIETSDISDKIYLKDEINELKKRYGVKDE